MTGRDAATDKADPVSTLVQNEANSADTLPVVDAPDETVAQLRQAVGALEAELHDEVILICEQILSANPFCAEALFLLGLVTYDFGEPNQAVTILEKAHDVAPHRQEIAEALAAILARIGKVSDALFYAKLATTLEPHPAVSNLLPERFGTFFRNLSSGNANFYLDRAERKIRVGHFAEAAEDCRRQLESTPGDLRCLRLLARASLAARQCEAAIAAFHAALHAGAPAAEDLTGLAQALAAAGRPDEAAACHGAAEALAPEDADLGSRRLATLAAYPATDGAGLDAAHADWARRHAAALRPHRPVAARDPDPDRPLRVGYLSGAFRRNDFTELFAPVLQGHRDGPIEAYCYSDGTQKDGVTEGLMQAADKWTDITGVDDESVWEILRGDEIDIAIDLSGHFEGGRPLVFARTAAPVSLGWLGYPTPPGIEAMDYFLTDAAIWPEGMPGPETGEQIWRLPRAPFAYRPPVHLPPVGDLPAAQAGHLTFGISGDLAAITPARTSEWASLLCAIDGARLVICNRFDQDQAAVERIVDLFSHFGLRSRVDVVNAGENFSSEFDFYHYVDLALDLGTAGATAENCRALWMGVPLLARAGGHAATRSAVGLLGAAGHPQWCAADRAALAGVARSFAQDPARLADLRCALRDDMAASALGDAAGLTREIEAAYRAMWRAHCAGA